eukprot:306964-Amphidinium_carterae.2
MFGPKTQAGGVPLKKPYKIVTTVEDLALHLRNFVCDKIKSPAWQDSRIRDCAHWKLHGAIL